VYLDSLAGHQIRPIAPPYLTLGMGTLPRAPVNSLPRVILVQRTVVAVGVLRILPAIPQLGVYLQLAILRIGLSVVLTPVFLLELLVQSLVVL